MKFGSGTINGDVYGGETITVNGSVNGGIGGAAEPDRFRNGSRRCSGVRQTIRLKGPITGSATLVCDSLYLEREAAIAGFGSRLLYNKS